jgi:hypothetical protein
MQIYINKNGQQLGPFAESAVLEMLGSGQLSPDDHAIRAGQQQWQKLEQMFPATKPAWTPPPVVQTSPSIPGSAQFQPAAPPKPGGSKGLIFGLLGCGGLLLVGIIGLAGFFVFFNQRSVPVEIAGNRTGNTANTANTNSQTNTSTSSKTPEYYKAYQDKTPELFSLKPSVKLDKAAKLGGKLTIIEKTSYNFDPRMVGFEVRANPNLQQYVSNDENAIKDYGFTFADLAESLDELDKLIQIDCNKGKVIGRYEGGITAYSNKCSVNVIDYKTKAIVAQQSFENSTPEKEIRTRKGQTEEVLLYPFAEIRKYIKGFPRQ